MWRETYNCEGESHNFNVEKSVWNYYSKVKMWYFNNTIFTAKEILLTVFYFIELDDPYYRKDNNRKYTHRHIYRYQTLSLEQKFDLSIESHYFFDQ